MWADLAGGMVLRNMMQLATSAFWGTGHENRLLRFATRDTPRSGPKNPSLSCRQTLDRANRAVSHRFLRRAQVKQQNQEISAKMVLLGRIGLASHSPNILKNNDIPSGTAPAGIAECNRFAKCRSSRLVIPSHAALNPKPRRHKVARQEASHVEK